MATLTPCRVSFFGRVSLLYITELSEHSVSNHPMNSSVPFSPLLCSGTEHLPVGIMASPLASRLACSSSRIEFVSYGLFFHFQLLSTPHYCDAVTFSYRPGNFGRTGLSPANSVCSKAHWQEASLLSCAAPAALYPFSPPCFLPRLPSGAENWEVSGQCAFEHTELAGESPVRPKLPGR